VGLMSAGGSSDFFGVLVCGDDDFFLYVSDWSPSSLVSVSVVSLVSLSSLSSPSSSSLESTCTIYYKTLPTSLNNYLLRFITGCDSWIRGANTFLFSHLIRQISEVVFRGSRSGNVADRFSL
jgi:hypothetical protein